MYCVEWMELHRERETMDKVKCTCRVVGAAQGERDDGLGEIYCVEWMELHRERETVGKVKCTV